MMKTLVVSLMCCAAVICTGCGKKAEDKKVQITAIDTTAAEAQFRSATPEVRAAFTSALTAIKEGKNAEAEEALRKLLQNGRLSAEQERVARELMTKIQS